jgi:hypothetical protein
LVNLKAVFTHSKNGFNNRKNITTHHMKNIFFLPLFFMLLYNSYALEKIYTKEYLNKIFSDSIPPNKDVYSLGRSTLFHQEKHKVLSPCYYSFTLPKEQNSFWSELPPFIDPSPFKAYYNLTSITIPHTTISILAQSFRGTVVKENLPPPMDWTLIGDWASLNCSLWLSIRFNIW